MPGSTTLKTWRVTVLTAILTIDSECLKCLTASVNKGKVCLLLLKKNWTAFAFNLSKGVCDIEEGVCGGLLDCVYGWAGLGMKLGIVLVVIRLCGDVWKVWGRASQCFALVLE